MRTVRKLAVYLRPYWKWAVLAPLFMVIEVAMDLMQPRMLQHIVDQGIARSDMDLILRTGLWMIGLAVIGIAAGMGCTVYAVQASQAYGADLRHDLFRKVQELSFANLDELEIGALVTRLTNDVSQVQDVVLILLRIMVRVPLLLIGSLIMAILTSSRLALLFVPLLPVVLIVLLWITRKMYPLFTEIQKRLDTLNIILQENLSGVRVIKAFARRDHEETRFGTANKSLVDNMIEAARIGSLSMPLMIAAGHVGLVGTIWFGGVSVIRGDLAVGQIIAFVNYLTQTLFSLIMVSMLVIRTARARASGERILEVLEAHPALSWPMAPNEDFRPRGRVTFESVRFAYDANDADPVIKNISFEAEPGQTVAILGATGAGKSSLVHLIPRFYDVSEGTVRIDGRDVRQIHETALRKTVGIALQESILFSGSIRDNIRFGMPDAADDEIYAAARVAQADSFIRGLPDGYNTLLGQRGVNLSGGQKQRVAIARALLPRPAVLILDDSTSAVDVATEAAIQDALSREHPGQTRLVVAQRISSVMSADKILVLDDGELVAQGTHEELLRDCPIYQEIHASQQESGVTRHAG